MRRDSKARQMHTCVVRGHIKKEVIIVKNQAAEVRLDQNIESRSNRHAQCKATVTYAEGMLNESC